MDRKELLQDIQAVKPAVGSNGNITFTDTGVIVGMSSEFTLYKHSQFSCFNATVEIKSLEELLKRIDVDDIDLTFEDSKIKIQWKRNTTKINTYDIPPPEIPDYVATTPNDVHVIDDPDVMTNKLANVLFCVGKEVSRPALSGVHITSGRIEACDNKRFIKYIHGELPYYNIILPEKSASVVTKMKPDHIYQPEEQGSIVFYDTSQGFVIESRLYGAGEDYPDLDAVPAKDEYPEHKSVVLPDGFMEAVERAEIVSHNHNAIDAVGVELYGNCVTVFTDSQSGSYYECVTVDENMEAREEGAQPWFYAQPHYLREAIQNGDKLWVGQNTLYVERDSEDMVYLCSLCNVTEEES